VPIVTIKIDEGEMKGKRLKEQKFTKKEMGIWLITERIINNRENKTERKRKTGG
jgi:hypothetical protein